MGRLTPRRVPAEGLGKKLDTSLKRHTALLVKLRSSLNQHAAVPALLNDISQLALEKYVEEAVGAVVEGLAKCKTAAEVAGAVEVRTGLVAISHPRLIRQPRPAPQVIVALHNRFPELFTPPFSSLLLQGLKPGPPSHAADKDIQEKENNARIIKQRTTLRIVGELEAIGIIRKESGGGGKGEKPSAAGMTGEITWAALRNLVSLWDTTPPDPFSLIPSGREKLTTRDLGQLTSDKEALPLVAPLAIAFAKHLGTLYLPPPPSSASAGAPTSDSNPESTDEFPTLAAAGERGTPEEPSVVALVPREIKDKFRKLLVAYFDALGKREQKLHLVRSLSPLFFLLQTSRG